MCVKGAAPCHPLIRLLYSSEPVYNAKIGPHNAFSVAIAVCEADPRLEIAKVRRIHLAKDAKVACRRKKIKVVAHAERKRQVRQHSPLILNVEVGQFVPERHSVGGLARRSVWSVVEAVLPGQTALRNLVSKIGPCLLEEELDSGTGTEVAERPSAEEALRTEDSDARREVWRLRREPDRLKLRANLDGVGVVRIGQRLSGLEVVLAVVIDAAKKSAAIERIGNIDCRLKTCAYRIHIEDAPAKGD